MEGQSVAGSALGSELEVQQMIVSQFMEMSEAQQAETLVALFHSAPKVRALARDILHLDRHGSIDSSSSGGGGGGPRQFAWQSFRREGKHVPRQQSASRRDFIENLPMPLVVLVLHFLDVNSLACVSMVSLRWNERCYSQQVDRLWKSEFLRLYRTSGFLVTQNRANMPWRALCQLQGQSKQAWMYCSNPKKRVYSGHKDRVRHVRICNNTIVSASWDKSLRVIYLDDEDELLGEGVMQEQRRYSKQVASHGGSVFGVWFDGEVAMTCSEDSTIKIWDVQKEQCVAELFGHESAVFRVAVVTRDILVSCARDFVGVWHWPSQTLMHQLLGHTHDVHRLQVTDSLIVTGSYDCTVRVWHYPSCEQAWASNPCHKGGLSCLYTDSETLASGSGKGQVFIWDLKTGVKRFAFGGHYHNDSTVSSVLVYGRRVFSTSILTLRKFDGIVCIWDALGGYLLNKIIAPYHINCIIQEFGLVFSACSDGYMRIHNADRDDFSEHQAHFHGNGALYDVNIQGSRAVTCGLDKKVVVWGVGGSV